jgi:hypothetical protein
MNDNVLSSFIDGVLGAPQSIANGIDVLLGVAGISDNRAHTAEHFGEFLSFLKTATFSEAAQEIARLLAEELVANYDEEITQVIRDFAISQAAKATGSVLTKSTFAKIISSSISNASVASVSKAVTGASALNKAITSVFAMLTLLNFSGKSGAATERLKRDHPRLHAQLKNRGLVGGYFLVEPAAQSIENRLRTLSD